MRPLTFEPKGGTDSFLQGDEQVRESGMSRFSPSEAALEGFRLTREHPATVLAWGVVYALGIFVIGQLMLFALGPEFVNVMRKGATSEDAEVIGGVLAQSWPKFLLVLGPVMALTAMFQAGIYRLVLRPQERGVLHLRFGADELKLTLVNVLMVAIGLLFLTAEFAAISIARTGGGPAAWVAVLAVAALTIWIGVRLSLVTPFTFAEHRIDLKAAWALTRGQFWPLLGMIVLAVIFYVMVWLLISIIGVALVTVAGGPEAIADVRRLGPAAWIAFLLYMGLELILQVVQLVMISAPLAVAYQSLLPKPQASAD